MNGSGSGVIPCIPAGNGPVITGKRLQRHTVVYVLLRSIICFRGLYNISMAPGNLDRICTNSELPCGLGGAFGGIRQLPCESWMGGIQANGLIKVFALQVS